MWNSKKIKALETQLKEANDRAFDYANRNQLILGILQDINKKIDPKPVVTRTYTVESKELAETISKMQRKKSCGSGGCGECFLVPTNLINSIINQK